MNVICLNFIVCTIFFIFVPSLLIVKMKVSKIIFLLIAKCEINGLLMLSYNSSAEHQLIAELIIWALTRVFSGLRASKAQTSLRIHEV